MVGDGPIRLARKGWSSRQSWTPALIAVSIFLHASRSQDRETADDALGAIAFTRAWMMKRINRWVLILAMAIPASSWAWHDETHMAIARAAGYSKWYNAAGADITKIKAGDVEKKNHYVNNPFGTLVTPQMVLDQEALYNHPGDDKGHLYGAILASIRELKTTSLKGKYAEYHLAFCAHYVGDLSMPLHNTVYNDFNQRYHAIVDGTIDDEVLDNLSRIAATPVEIQSEGDVARAIARVANQSITLGYQLEKEERSLSKEEAYGQVSLSASLFRGILAWLKLQ